MPGALGLSFVRLSRGGGGELLDGLVGREEFFGEGRESSPENISLHVYIDFCLIPWYYM
jgi:hypothetical protein